MIRVQILLETEIFVLTFKEIKTNEKEAGVGPFEKEFFKNLVVKKVNQGKVAHCRGSDRALQPVDPGFILVIPRNFFDVDVAIFI